MGSAQLTCRSVMLAPPTYPITGGTASVLFSTATFSHVFQIDKNAAVPVSLEFSPDGAGNYNTEYIRVEKDLITEYGIIRVPIPTGDANGNGLIDFVEMGTATDLQLTGSIESYVPAPRSYSVKARFQRAAGSPNGTYRFECTPTTGGGTAFTVEDAYSLVVYSRARSRFMYEHAFQGQSSWRLDLFDADNGTGAHDAWSAPTTYVAGSTSVPRFAFSLSMPDGANVAVTTEDFVRAGSGYRMSCFLRERGLLALPFHNYTAWVLELDDPNDINANGVPDFDDATYFITEVKIRQRTPGPLVIGQPAEFDADVTYGGSGFAFQWYVNGSPILGATGSRLRIEKLAMAPTSWGADFRVVLHGKNPRGPEDIDELRPEVDMTPLERFGGGVGEGSVNWDVAPGSIYHEPSFRYDSFIGTQPAVLRRDLPEKCRIELGDFKTATLMNGSLSLVWRSDASSPASNSGLLLVMRHAGFDGSKVKVEFTLSEPGRGVLAQYTRTDFTGCVIEDDGENIRLGDPAQPDAVVSTTYRRGAKLLLLPLPDGATLPLASWRYLNLSVYPTPWLQDPPRSSLAGLSTRGWAGSGENTMTAGVVVSGQGKRLLVRGGGPKLTEYGISDALPDPMLSAYRGIERFFDNDNWETGETSAALIPTFDRIGLPRFAAGSRDAAFLTEVDGGAYTFQLTGRTTAGTGLVEVYDANPGNSARIVGLSTRGRIEGENKIMVAGVIVTGPDNCLVLVRASGDTLWKYGVPNTISDPDLRLFDSAGRKLVENASWSGVGDTTQLTLAAAQIGLGRQDYQAESAILVSLPPGAYTFHAVGRYGSAGVALLELYEVR